MLLKRANKFTIKRFRDQPSCHPLKTTQCFVNWTRYHKSKRYYNILISSHFT